MQSVSTFSVLQAGQQIDSRLDEATWLPSFGATWMINDEQQLRFGWSRTLSRPDFRELSPAPFLDPILDILTFGNPDLQTARITNLDLRWEYYFSADESLSVALFRKTFDKPIEKLLLPATGSLLQTLANADRPPTRGSRSTTSSAWAGPTAGSAAWTCRTGSSPPTILDRLRDPPRPGPRRRQHQPEPPAGRPVALRGQPAARLQQPRGDPRDGAQLQHQRQAHRSGGHRYPARRLRAAGAVTGLQLEVAVRPRVVDRLRLRNLLDPSVEFRQGDINIREFKRGREINLSLEWSPKRGG
jgi:hypothetical protein